MNYEQAVERILKGSPFTQCRTCQGTGKTGSPFFGDQELCKSCDGRASCPDPIYMEACLILGRPTPVNSLGLFVRARNQMDLQKLRPDPLYLSPELMNDIVSWNSGK